MPKSKSAGYLRRFAGCAESLEKRLLLSSTWTVTSTADDSSSGTLRYAVVQSAPGDTIQFDPTAFPYNGHRTISLTSGSIQLIHSLTIIGPGATALSISGNNAWRVFNMPSDVTESISGLTITGGNGGSMGGGGISNGGSTLSLTNVTVTGNSARLGGGVYTYQGTTTVTNSTIANNTATAYGGASYCDFGANVTFTACTLNNNTAPIGGGVCEDGTTLTLVNDTLTANSATGNAGGAIRVLGGTLNVSDSTIDANTSIMGAGIWNDSGSVTINNTIVAQNTNGTLPEDIGGSMSGSYNLIGAGSVVSGSNNLTGTVANPIDPQLYPLGNYGGPTLTMLPRATSPVIDAGSNALIPSGVTTDQRGFTRIILSFQSVDIGACEFNAPLLVNGTPGSDTIVVDSTASGGIKIVLNGVETDYPAGAYDALDINTGQAPTNPAKQISVLATVVSTAVTLVGANSAGPGGSVTVGKAGSMQGIQQQLTVNAPNGLPYAQYAPVTLDDSAETASRHVTVTNSYLGIEGMSPGNVSASRVQIKTPSASGNVVDLQSGAVTTIIGNTPSGGVLTVNFGNATVPATNIANVNVLENGAGTDALAFDDSADRYARTVTLTSQSFSWNGSPDSFDPTRVSSLLFKGDSAGNTVVAGPFTSMNKATITLDTGTGNDSTGVSGVPVGVAVNVEGQVGSDSIGVGQGIDGVVNFHNSGGADYLDLNLNSAVNSSTGKITLSAFTPAGSTDGWQQIAGLGAGDGQVNYDAAEATAPVTIIQNSGNPVTVLGTPDYPAGGGSSTPDLQFEVSGLFDVQGIGNNGVIGLSSTGTVDTDFGAATFGVATQLQISAIALKIQGASSSDPFTVSGATISHGPTTIHYSGGAVSLNTGTFNYVTPAAQVYELDVNGPGTSLIYNAASGSFRESTLKVNGGHVGFTPAGQTFVLCATPSFSNGGQLDVGNATVVFPLVDSASIRGWIAAGYNNGGWNGTGIICSTLTPGYALAYGSSPTGIAKALIGDANVDGTVGLADLLALTRNFGKSNVFWGGGDFNYDGKADISDFLALTRNFGKSTPALAGVASAYSSAPRTTPGETDDASSELRRRRTA